MDMQRTFPAPYVDARVKRPDFPLAEALAWYMADKPSMGEGTAATTMRTYFSHLRRFIDWLDPERRTLRSLEPETYERYVRATTTNQNTRMNKIVAAKSFARYLADRKLWYAGTADARLSVLRELKQPRPSAKGQPGYTDAEIRTMYEAVSTGPNRLRNRAVLAIELHGFRAKEARSIQRRNVILPRFREQGHVILDDEGGTKRGTHGVREVPIEGPAMDALREYLRLGRPAYQGEGEEPLFLTDDGLPITHDGWHSMARRLHHLIAKETGIQFRQHRLRSTRVRLLHEAGWPDSAICEVMGWGASGYRMLRRYRGTIPTTQLKSYPQVLHRLLAPAS